MGKISASGEAQKTTLAVCHLKAPVSVETGHLPQLKRSRVLARRHQRATIATAIHRLDEVSPYQSDFKFCLGVRRIRPQTQSTRSFPGQTKILDRAWRGFQIDNLKSAIASFPLDGTGWLSRNIVDDAIHAFYFVDDPVGNSAEQFVRKTHPIRRHAILAFDYS